MGSADSRLAKVLAFAAVAEIAAGIAFVMAPAFVITILLAPSTLTAIIPISRVTGIALIALGFACWSGWNRAGEGAFRALLTYNLLVAAYLAYLGAVEHLGGLLLWPAVAFHAAVTGILLYFWRAGRDSGRPSAA